MRILITNCTLAGRSGTEILTLNLVKALRNLGHLPSVYSPALGPIAEEIRQLGVNVTDTIDSIAETPDIIHGHHTMETATAALHFPETPAIFVCHDFTAWHDTAPDLPNIAHYYAISEGFRTRLTQIEGLTADKCSVILNGIDTQRFTPVTPLAASPRKALIFAKNNQHLSSIRQACDQLGIPHDTIGAAVNKLTDTPETLIQDYDLVFTSAMSAMECMAAGRAVIACDGRGLAGFVSPERYDGWHRENFGLPTFDQPLATANFVTEIQRYNADHARIVTGRVRQDSCLQSWATRYVAAYEQAISDFIAPSGHQSAVSASRFIENWFCTTRQPAWHRQIEHLENRMTLLEQGLLPFPLNKSVPANSSQYLALSGFHSPDSWGGVWSSRARFALRLMPASRFSSLTLHGAAYTSADRSSYNLSVRINGLPVGEAVAGSASCALVFRFEPINDHVIWVEIDGDTPLSPATYGGSDRRELGFALTAVTLA